MGIKLEKVCRAITAKIDEQTQIAGNKIRIVRTSNAQAYQS